MVDILNKGYDFLKLVVVVKGSKMHLQIYYMILYLVIK